MKAYKCGACGWLHAAIPAVEIRAALALEAHHRAQPTNPGAPLPAHYLRCCKCAADTAGFTPASPDDAPLDRTISAVFVPGAFAE